MTLQGKKVDGSRLPEQRETKLSLIQSTIRFSVNLEMDFAISCQQ
jgi:hypothetical protein